MKTHISIGLL